ncbi:hypothetical protein GOP47_0026467 [Adiantum capillus-veneris]|nr:hypothetical protein GOP47_0026467 [Adiantum capillus-veneris]
MGHAWLLSSGHSQAATEASELDDKGSGERKTDVQQRHRSLHTSSRQGPRRPNVSNIRKDIHFDQEADNKFMREALYEAQKAAASDEVPVGAVLVSQGRVVARAHNRVESDNDPMAHAEMICIRDTARHLGGWRLLDSTLYVTLEPCPMCAGALLQARVGAVVWGAQNPLLGADGSWVSLFPKQSLADDCEEQLLDCEMKGAVKKRGLVHPFNPNIRVRGGVLASDCSEIMKDFFRRRRRHESNKAQTRTNSYSILSRLFSGIRKALHVVVSFISYLGLDWIFRLRRLG